MDDLKGRLVVGFLRLFALLPWRAVQAVGSAIGWLMWKLPNGSRQVVRVNLGKCFPDMSAQEREALVGQTLKDIGKTLTESACAWIWPAQKSLGLIRQVEGMEVLQQALQSGKGVVLISSHLGNWEMLLQYVCSLCQPSILYRPPKLKAVDELLVRQRTQLGNELAPSTREGILSLVKRVRNGGIAGIAADPEPSRSSGVFVPFFGVSTLTSKFVPSLVHGHKAVAVFMHALRLADGSGYRVIIEAAPEALYGDDVELAVAALNQGIEKQVRQAPSQYMWSMKRFKKRPDGEKKWY
ncbi:lipid A biosynthesis lauroyl acyltransferase [Pseudomonas sp. HAR-UPW-AIA-41]|uniref:lysophospholipid acyltransferase n=1 Tax=Pseudomonas sp. HAR-UPW-AIA-41 TaxID=1985301 RepID=UPI000BB396EC|nr:lysophospholipid acyltransferase [Pseudomonas sp. HAR-UPW-AIA-41]PAV47301.1 lipid A biosynthesis lauroyl acyltransferase [Pseudomonas sp. HAR-UPW-AIA-41]